MKKLLAILMVAALVISMAACQKPEESKQEEPDKNAVVLEDTDPDHVLWSALGQFLLADGTANGWGDKDAETFEASALKAISMNDLKAIDEEVFNKLSAKDVKCLYTIDLLFGTNDAGWTTNCLIDGVLYRANGSYAFKIGPCTLDVDGETKVYSVAQWISDPHTAYVESLTPDTAFYPAWQEEKDENGFDWSQNPVCIGGAGLYTLVVAQYANASAEGTPGYGVALVKKEEKEGIAYEEIVTFVPADHTYGIVGSFEASNWGEKEDVAMEADGENTWKGEVELKAGEEWKVRADSDWTYSWGAEDGSNLKAEADGTYVVTLTFDGETGTVTAEAKAE